MTAPTHPDLRRSLPVLLAAAAIVFGGCGKLDRDAVETNLGSVRSAAAEGMLVADQAARARAPDNFIEIRTAELAKVGSDASMSLAGTPAEAGLERAAVQGAHLGASVADQLDALHDEPSDRALAGRTRDHLRILAGRAARIEDSL
jgi:hypothetical protein